MAQPELLDSANRGRRRAAGIYGSVITAAIIAASDKQLPTHWLVIEVLVTLVVYWIAEQYAEILGEHAERGHLPTWAQVRVALAASWAMVAASYLPLLALVITRVAGAAAPAAANAALVVAVLLVVYHGWSAGRAVHLEGRALLAATSAAVALGLLMIVLKDVVLIHLH
jgi:hypothetical protein